jgi:hypothetical protein
MTALDTTNLRLTFTAPDNGSVLVRLRGTVFGAAATFPVVLLGVLRNGELVARQAPNGGLTGTAAAATRVPREALFTVSGLTSGSSYTWDAAYGVEVALTGAGIRYGGDDTNSADAFGGFQFEIYDAPTLLGSILYDPTGGAMVNKATTSRLAMTAIDTANLRLNFTAPDSGNVLVRMRTAIMGATTAPQILLGVLAATTVYGRTCPVGAYLTTATTATLLAVEGQAVITGITAGSACTWDAAYAVQAVVGSTGIKYGGPNNTTASDAAGGFLFEVWEL